MLRLRATDPAHRIGSLFVNPGGPAGSGVEFAAAATSWLSPDVRARFDVVGVDPRGTNFSDNVRCWPNSGAQAADLAGLHVAIPLSNLEQRRAVTSAKAFGRACSTTGKPLSGSMSTAEVARDLDVLRRAVGDSKLTYLGFSYGSYLGTVYANLFPDRVRALSIDGVLDPVAWAGTRATAGTPQTARLRSGQGGARALDEILARCGKAGPLYCSFAGFGDPAQNYARLVEALKKQPLVFTDPVTGTTYTFGYGDLVAYLLGALYAPIAGQIVDSILTDVFTLALPAATAAVSARSAAASSLAERLTANGSAAASRYALPYFNGPEAFQSVLCTDGLNPADAGRWPVYAAAEDQGSRLRAAVDLVLCSVRHADLDRRGPGRLLRPIHAPNLRAGARRRQLLGPGHELRRRRHGLAAAPEQLPAVQRQLGAHCLRHLGVRDHGDGHLPAHRVPAAPRNECTGDDQPFTTPLSGPPASRPAPARVLPPIDPIRPNGVVPARS